jgi:hypothetical protein
MNPADTQQVLILLKSHPLKRLCIVRSYDKSPLRRTAV